MLINRPALQGGKFIKQTGVCAVRKTGVLNVKFKKGGSSGGHNGIKSIDALIGADYERVRIGVGKKRQDQDAANFVLGNFNESEREKLSEILPYVARAVEELICSDIEQIAQKFTIKKARV